MKKLEKTSQRPKKSILKEIFPFDASRYGCDLKHYVPYSIKAAKKFKARILAESDFLNRAENNYLIGYQGVPFSIDEFEWVGTNKDNYWMAMEDKIFHFRANVDPAQVGPVHEFILHFTAAELKKLMMAYPANDELISPIEQALAYEVERTKQHQEFRKGLISDEAFGLYYMDQLKKRGRGGGLTRDF